MKQQVKRFSEFVNENYYHEDEFGPSMHKMSPCCGSDIDDQNCCTECGEECGEPDWDEPMHGGYHEEDEMPHSHGMHGMHRDMYEAKGMSKKMKPMPEDDMELELDEPVMPKAKKAKAMPKMPMPKAPAAKGPMAKKEMSLAKPGKAGVDLIRGAAKANAMKQMDKAPMPKMPKRGMM